MLVFRGNLARCDLTRDFPPIFERVLGFLLWDQILDRRKLEFSGSDHDDWLVAPPGLCRAIEPGAYDRPIKTSRGESRARDVSAGLHGVAADLC